MGPGKSEEREENDDAEFTADLPFALSTLVTAHGPAILRGQRPAFEHLLGGKLSIVAIYLGWRVHEVIDPSAKKGNSPHSNSDPSSDLDGFGILCHPDGIKTAAEAGCEE